MHSIVPENGSVEFSPASLAETVRGGHISRQHLRHEPGHCDRIGQVLYWCYVAVPVLTREDIGLRLGIRTERVRGLDVRGRQLLVRVVRQHPSVGESIQQHAPELWRVLAMDLPRR